MSDLRGVFSKVFLIDFIIIIFIRAEPVRKVFLFLKKPASGRTARLCGMVSVIEYRAFLPFSLFDHCILLCPELTGNGKKA